MVFWFFGRLIRLGWKNAAEPKKGIFKSLSLWHNQPKR